MNIMKPRIAFCITCKGRSQHLKQTLPTNLSDNQNYPNTVFILLDYSSTDDLTQYIREHHQKDIDSGRLVLYSLPGQSIFKMAHAKNVAHRCGIREGADILVNLDADNYTGIDFASYVAGQFETFGGNIFLFAKMIKGVLSRGISGRIVVTKNAFLKLGGYDEKFDMWSPDDKDFNARLKRLDYIPVEIDPRYLLAVKHTDKMRFREYPHAANTPYEEIFICTSDQVIANYGHFGEGTVYRNWDNQPIRLGPVPTRIFGIGMHKTGTTSLHKAFEILGFDSGHWLSAHWAKAIWLEVKGMSKSPILEHYYTLSDLPIPILYRELDQNYPGSKFILTIREENDWVESAEGHWNYKRNKYRYQWDTDPFSHFIHKEIYGQRGFDKDIFLNRYRKHNSDVINYFRNRPEDLLILERNTNMGWEALCKFLDLPIPAVPYPRVNTGVKKDEVR